MSTEIIKIPELDEKDEATNHHYELGRLLNVLPEELEYIDTLVSNENVLVQAFLRSVRGDAEPLEYFPVLRFRFQRSNESQSLVGELSFRPIDYSDPQDLKFPIRKRIPLPAHFPNIKPKSVPSAEQISPRERVLNAFKAIEIKRLSCKGGNCAADIGLAIMYRDLGAGALNPYEELELPSLEAFNKIHYNGYSSPILKVLGPVSTAGFNSFGTFIKVVPR